MSHDAKIADAQEKVIKAYETLLGALKQANRADEASAVSRKVDYLKRKLAKA